MRRQPAFASVLFSVLCTVLPSNASNGCSSGDYRSDLGLSIDVYCNRTFADETSLGHEQYDNLDSCLNACSQKNRPFCFAATFDTATSNCSYFDQRAAGSNTIVSQTIHLGIVDPATQLTQGFDTQCPYANGSAQPVNGVEFTILCGLNEVYNDYCSINGTPCPIHTTTLEDCLQYCTEAHPLCAGVSWNPDMVAGYGNCYLKTGWPDQPFSTAQGDISTGATFWVHSAAATIKNGTSMPYSCDSQEQITASNGKTFIANCDVTMTGNSFAYSHQDSLDACVDACATWDDGSCVGVSWDATMLSGWENCCLMNDTNPLQRQEKVSVALMAVDASNNTTSNTATTAPTATPTNDPANSQSSSSGGGSHTKEIVGGILGGVGGVVALAVAVWYFGFKKPKDTRDETFYGPVAQDLKGDVPVQVAELETNARFAEMESPGENASRAELDASNNRLTYG